MKIAAALCVLLLSSSVAHAEYVSDKEFRRQVTATNNTSDREMALSKYINQNGTIFSSGIGKKIRTQILWLAQIDFYAAAQGSRHSKLPPNRLAEVAAGLPPDLKTALEAWWRWDAEDQRAQTAATPSRAPYPASLPAPGHPLGQGPAHVLGAPAARFDPKNIPPPKVAVDKRDDCETILRKAALAGGPPPGALVYSHGSGGNCRENKKLWLFSCEAKSFMTYDGKGFTMNEKPYNYRVCDPGPYDICPTCHGRASSKGSAYVQDTAFHQTNFNVYTSDPNLRKKIDTYDICDTCKGVGYLRK